MSFRKLNIKSIILNILFLLPLFLVFLYAVWVRTKIPHLVVEVWDEYQFLILSIDSKNGFDSGMTMPYYQLIVLVFTKIFNSFSGIVIYHHLLFIGIITLYFYIVRTLFLKILKNFPLIIKILLYVLYVGFMFLYVQSPELVLFEYSMRPEMTSIFFQFVFISIYLNIIFSKNISKNKLYLYLSICISALFFQPKLIIVTILNIFLISYYILYKSKYFLKHFIKIFIILIAFLSFHFITTSIIKRTDFHRGLLISNIFWKNIPYIKKYVYNDLHDQSFNKYNKKILSEVVNIYDNNINTYIAGISNVTQIDPITYEIGVDVLIDNDPKEVTDMMHHYFFKSLLFSPHEYLNNYLSEWMKIVRKQNLIFIPSQLIIDQVVYKTNSDWLSYWYRNRFKSSLYLTEYIDKTKNQSLIPLSVQAPNYYQPLLKKINDLFFIVIYLYIILLFYKSNNELIKKMRTLTNILLLSAFSMYSFTVFLFVYLERYITEVYPFWYFSLFFMIVSIVITVHNYISNILNVKR